jgi:antitoxin VapB
MAETAMAFLVRDRETDSLVRELAHKRGVGLTEAVRLAVQHELERDEAAIPLRERITALQKDVLRRPRTGLVADKAFFDELSGNL